MKRLSALILLLSASLLHAETLTPEPTPAEQKIAQATSAIADEPERFQGYNDLAAAYVKRAREVGDSSYYEKADERVNHALQLEPNNWESRKIHVAILLGRHDYVRALEEAQPMNRQMRDDILVYGYLADAYMGLGKYDEALDAAQWMLNMRPGNVPGLIRGAALREHFEDFGGALEFLDSAYQKTSFTEVEDRAWILTRMAHLLLRLGDTASAEKKLQEALVQFPGYHESLAVLAEVQAARERTNSAQMLGAATSPEHPNSEPLRK